MTDPTASETRSLKPAEFTDTQRLDWWFSNGMQDDVCEGSVCLWWATEINGDVATVVTHGTSLRGTLDMAMRGIHDPI